MATADVQASLTHLDRGGRQLPLYTAKPTSQPTGRKLPAIIVIHEIFGLNDHIKDLCRRFAMQGLVAYGPDLFAGSSDLPADRNDLDAMRQVWQNIPDSQLISDLQRVQELAANDSLVDRNSIGTVGYCMGGAIALIFACSTPGIAWIADYYGRINYPQLTDRKPKHPIDYVEQLHCAFLGLFSGQDELIPEDQINALTERLKASGRHFQVKTYPNAKHAFFNDQREHYDSEAASDAWKLTLQFIADNSSPSVKA